MCLCDICATNPANFRASSTNRLENRRKTSDLVLFCSGIAGWVLSQTGKTKRNMKNMSMQLQFFALFLAVKMLLFMNNKTGPGGSFNVEYMILVFVLLIDSCTCLMSATLIFATLAGSPPPWWCQRRSSFEFHGRCAHGKIFYKRVRRYQKTSNTFLVANVFFEITCTAWIGSFWIKAWVCSSSAVRFAGADAI